MLFVEVLLDRNAPDHRRAFERDTPSMNMHVLRKTHRLKHLGSKHAAVSNFNPLIQHRMKRENLKRWL